MREVGGRGRWSGRGGGEVGGRGKWGWTWER